MTVARSAAALLAALWMGSAAAQFEPRRALSDPETRTAIEALLRDAGSKLSEDPSCKADLNAPGSMSIGEGLAVALVRAATDREPVQVVADCFVRRGYPLDAGEEYCRLALTKPQRPAFGYGLVFVMNWKAKRVRPGSVECF